MESVNAALQVAIADITRQFGEKVRGDLSANRGAQIPRRHEQPKQTTDFELVSWLVIRDIV